MKTQRLEQGTNISSGCPGPRGPGTTHNKIDQGRSLTLRAPQGCLRVWVRRIQPTVREQVNLHRRLGSYPAYLSTPRRPSSHPRGFRLIHLSKSCVTKVLRRQPLRVHRRSTFFVPPAVEAFAFPTGGGGSYRPFRPCQSAASKIFVQPSRLPD